MGETSQGPEPSTSGCLSILLRLYWLVLGQFALAILCFKSIAKDRPSNYMDLYFPAVVGTMILARYLDIKYFKGTTASGDLATWGSFFKYTSILVGMAAVTWFFLANIHA